MSLICFLLCIISSVVFGDEQSIPLWPWKAAEYVTLVPQRCFTGHTELDSVHNVCDPDGLFTVEQVIELSGVLAQIENSTACVKNCLQDLCAHEPNARSGLIIGVAFAKEILHHTSDIGGSPEEPFADGIRHKWGLSSCKNDLVIFVSVDTQQISVSMGNISATIFGSMLDKVFAEISEKFKQTELEHYQSFVVNASTLLSHTYRARLQKLTEEQITNTAANTQERWWNWNTVLTIGYCLIIALILLIACYYCCVKKPDNKHPNASSIESELTTKYSELKVASNADNAENSEIKT